MNKRILVTFLVLILMGVLNIVPKVLIVKASGTIYIRADGSIDPPTANITRDLYNVIYTFNGTNYDSLHIERSNIIVNGSGFKLQGPKWETGLYLNQISNVTIINMEINDFRGWSGVSLDRCSNITFSNVVVVNNKNRGIDIYQSSNVSIVKCNITRNGYGITVTHSSNVKISENNITKNYPLGAGWVCSMRVENSLNVAINGNTIADNENGISIANSNNTQVLGNNITANREFGILIGGSSEAVLSDNLLNGNQYEFGVSGWKFHHFLHTIDTSNLIDGKPIYYLLDQQDITINNLTHPQVGYLALINSTNVTVENLNLTSNMQGLLLAYTNNTQIQNNNVINNDYGIELYTASNNTLVGNTIAYNMQGLLLDDFSNNNSIYKNSIVENSYDGMELEDSVGNIISENNITANFEHGILLDVSSNNTVSGNNIKNNNEGIEFSDSSNNTITRNNFIDNGLAIAIYYSSNNFIHHNNFIDNTDQAYVSDPQYQNSWDDGVEGNYWSNYTGVDSNHDGIGDTPHILNENNTDNKPLMGIFNSFSIQTEYHVNVISNSTIESFQYFDSNSSIRMYVSNMTADQTHGFCRITIPHEIINVTDIQVIIDDGDIEVLYANYTLYDNGTHRWIYFAYTHSTHKIDIIPELSSKMIIFTFLILSTIALPFLKKHRKMQKHNQQFSFMSWVNNNEL